MNKVGTHRKDDKFRLVSQWTYMWHKKTKYLLFFP